MIENPCLSSSFGSTSTAQDNMNLSSKLSQKIPKLPEFTQNLSATTIRIIIIVSVLVILALSGFLLLNRTESPIELPESLREEISKIEDKAHHYQDKIKEKAHKTLSKLSEITHRNIDVSKCDECIKFEDLVPNLGNLTIIEKQMNEKLNLITNVTLNPSEKIVLKPVEKLEKRMSRVSELQTKINGLVALNETFKEELSEALSKYNGYINSNFVVIEENIKELDEEYGNKVKEIENMKRYVFGNLSEFLTLESDVKLLEILHQVFVDKTQEDTSEIAVQRRKIMDSQSSIIEEISKLLEKESFKTVEDLEREIMNKEEKINSLNVQVKELQAQNNTYGQRLMDLELKINSYSERTISIETALHQKRWVLHTLEKIKMLEKITKELFELKYSSAAETVDSIKEINLNIEKTKREIEESLHQGHEGNIDPVHIQSLKDRVQVQDTLLKNWQSQQSKTSEVADQEIRENEAYIAHLKKNIYQLANTGEIEFILKEKEEINIELKRSQEEIEEIKINQKKANEKIEEMEMNLRVEQEKTLYLKNAKKDIDNLQIQLAQKNLELETAEKSITEMQQECERRGRDLNGRMKSVERHRIQRQEEIKKLVNKINERALQYPRFEDVKVEAENLAAKVKQVNSIYDSVDKLFEEIKSLL